MACLGYVPLTNSLTSNAHGWLNYTDERRSDGCVYATLWIDIAAMGGGSSYGYYIAASAYINGSLVWDNGTIKDNNMYTWNQYRKTLGTFGVTYNTTGTYSIQFRITNGEGFNELYSYTVAVPAALIPNPATFNPTPITSSSYVNGNPAISGKDGSWLHVNVNGNGISYRQFHLYIGIAGSSSNIFGQVFDVASNGYVLNVNLGIMFDGLKDVKSADLNFRVYSFVDGNDTTVGSCVVTKTIYLVDCEPTWDNDTFTLTENNSVVKNSGFNIFINNLSSASAVFSKAIGNNGATISNYNIKVGSYEEVIPSSTVTGDNYVKNGITISGSTPKISYTVTATDSRGYTATKTIDKYNSNYTPPVISNMSISRDSNGVGTGMQIGFIINSITPTNACANVLPSGSNVNLYYRIKNSTDDYTEVSEIGHGNGIIELTVTVILLDIPTENEYEFYLSIADTLQRNTITNPSWIFPAGSPLLSYRPKMIGINTVPNTGDFSSNKGGLKVNGDLNITGKCSSNNMIGMIAFFACSSAPVGWLKCNGALLNRTSYPDLFSIIGTTVDSSVSSTEFRIPDLRGEFLRGWDDGRGKDSGRILGTGQDDELKAHSHVQNLGRPWSNVTNVAGSGVVGNTDTSNTDDTGGSETRPTNIAWLACIKY